MLTRKYSRTQGNFFVFIFSNISLLIHVHPYSRLLYSKMAVTQKGNRL